MEANLRSFSRYLMVSRKSSWSSVRRSIGLLPLLTASVSHEEGAKSAFSCSLMLNFMRPTREKSYLRGSKNMPWNSCVAVSSVGGSPGRNLR